MNRVRINADTDVYFAARYALGPELRAKAADLENRTGCNIKSSWIYRVGAEENPPNLLREAETDIREIDFSDVVVLFTEPLDVDVPLAERGGRHFEFGYAYARRKIICVVGGRENVFCHLTEVKCFDDWDQFINSIYLSQRA